MIWIVIDGGVVFAPNQGVLLRSAVLDWAPERLHEAVRIAYAHMGDRFLKEACHGGCGPLADCGEVAYEEYLELTQAAEENERLAQAGRAAKKQHTEMRRREFNAGRSHLVLAMLDAGVPYQCAHEGCTVIVDLTVDHVVPLSRGGTDELPNLRFLCMPHNSAKGDR